MTHPKISRWLLNTIPVLLIALLLSACGQSEQSMEVTEVLRPVKFMLVTNPDSARIRTYSGSLQAGSELNRSFKVGGTVLTIPVNVGDDLNKDDIIATLDKTSYELEVAKASASLAQAKAEKRNTDSKYKRTKGLYENNNTSRDALESSRANAETSRAQVRSASKGLELAKLDLSDAEIKATEACQVAEVLVEVNENVNAGTAIVALSCGEVNEVSVSVPENIIASIQRDMLATVHFDAIADTLFSALVTEVGVTANNSTYPVTLNLNESHDQLRSGLAADISFSFDNEEAQSTRLFLPPVAVSEDSQGRFVFTLEPADDPQVAIVKRRSVEVGELTSQGVEVISGIEQGNKVVTAGISIIRDGLRVKAL